ncbi:type IV pilin protein [Flavimobilis rhizosphaerae]|uniref:type IV pilin protein n=1 Tax=Flavimobilis rhizosphaerae TaxID=2775421 RepID=UPI0022A68874|nr:prepilin-type N-terminal cleavage/methylation domain-containing protein [Flavimobilis rhizosphaerae]
MIARVSKALNKKDGDKGFTLVELLVVVIIIGILAAIAIPMFLKQREKAWEKQVVSDMKNSITAAEAFATSNNGKYNGMTTATLVTNGYRATPDVTITATPKSTGLGYDLTGSHANLTGKSWTYNSDEGIIKEGAAPTTPANP